MRNWFIYEYVNTKFGCLQCIKNMISGWITNKYRLRFLLKCIRIILKYFNVIFTRDECTLTNDDPNNEQWECTSPTIQANLLNPNGALSNETITIELNNTIP